MLVIILMTCMSLCWSQDIAIVVNTEESDFEQLVCTPPAVGGDGVSTSHTVLYDMDTVTVVCPMGQVCFGLCSTTCIDNMWTTGNADGNTLWMGVCLNMTCEKQRDCPVAHTCNNQTGICHKHCNSKHQCHGYEICIDGICHHLTHFTDSIDDQWLDVSKLQLASCNYAPLHNFSEDAGEIEYSTPWSLRQEGLTQDQLTKICAVQCVNHPSCEVTAYDPTYQRCPLIPHPNSKPARKRVNLTGPAMRWSPQTRLRKITKGKVHYVTNITQCVACQIVEGFKFGDTLIDIGPISSDIETVTQCCEKCHELANCICYRFEKDEYEMTRCYWYSALPSQLIQTGTQNQFVGISRNK